MKFEIWFLNMFYLLKIKKEKKTLITKIRLTKKSRKAQKVMDR